MFLSVVLLQIVVIMVQCRGFGSGGDRVFQRTRQENMAVCVHDLIS